MKNVFLLVQVVLLLNITSCTHKKLSRDEWQKVGQKEYTGVSKEELITAAQKVLVLADGNDISFASTKDGFVASRNWQIYAALAANMGTDYWTFEAKEEKGKLIATIQPSMVVGTVGGYSENQKGNPVQGTAIYEMFWTRLDYMLKRRSSWHSCKEGLDKSRSGETWGSLEQICDSITLNDDYPDDLSDEEIERIFAKDYHNRISYYKKHRPQKYLEEKKKNPNLH